MRHEAQPTTSTGILWRVWTSKRKTEFVWVASTASPSIMLFISSVRWRGAPRWCCNKRENFKAPPPVARRGRSAETRPRPARHFSCTPISLRKRAATPNPQTPPSTREALTSQTLYQPPDLRRPKVGEPQKASRRHCYQKQETLEIEDSATPPAGQARTPTPSARVSATHL